MCGRIEVDEIARGDVHGPEAQPHGTGIAAVEVDHVLQRRPERSGVVIARRLDGAGGP
jgi:hypothetical protein